MKLKSEIGILLKMNKHLLNFAQRSTVKKAIYSSLMFFCSEKNCTRTFEYHSGKQ